MTRFALSALLTLVISKADSENDKVEFNLQRPNNDLINGDPSLKFQADVTDSLKNLAENINNLATNKASSKAGNVGAIMSSALDSGDQVKDAADYDETATAMKDDDAKREGEEDALEAEEDSKYKTASDMKLADKFQTRKVEKNADLRRKAGIENLDNVLDADDDAEDIAEQEADSLENSVPDIDESDIDEQIEDQVSGASKLIKDAESGEAKFAKKAKQRVEDANIEHLLKSEDCPPGYVARSSLSEEDLAKRQSSANTTSADEPCPVALADAPCPCIMESFEPLKLEKAESSSTPKPSEAQQQHGSPQPDEDGGTQNCEEFMKDVNAHFGDDMSSVTHEALEPFAANLRKGSKAGIRKISS